MLRQVTQAQNQRSGVPVLGVGWMPHLPMSESFAIVHNLRIPAVLLAIFAMLISVHAGRARDMLRDKQSYLASRPLWPLLSTASKIRRSFVTRALFSKDFLKSTFQKYSNFLLGPGGQSDFGHICPQTLYRL